LRPDSNPIAQCSGILIGYGFVVAAVTQVFAPGETSEHELRHDARLQDCRW
jgi:hypothetical protein